MQYNKKKGRKRGRKKGRRKDRKYVVKGKKKMGA